MSSIQHYSLLKVFKRTARPSLIRALEVMSSRGGFTYPADIQKAPFGEIRKANYLEGVIRQLDSSQTKIIHAECQWFNIMAFTQRIATNIFNELEAAGQIVDDSVRGASLATLAAHAYAHLPIEAWRRLCTQAQIMQIGKNAWTTVKVRGVPEGFSIDPSDEKQEEIKKFVCGFIYSSEGRAEQGYCSYYKDDVRDEHIFRIVMTDHPQYKKVWVKKSIFRERTFKDTTEIVFRYSPRTEELSVCSDGDETFDRALCLRWRDALFSDMPEVEVVIPNKDVYYLDFIKRSSGTLAIPEGSSVTSARVIYVRADSLSNRSDFYGIHVSQDQDVHLKLVNSWQANNASPADYSVKRLEIEFIYVDPFGATQRLRCYFTRSSSNWLSMQSDAQEHIRGILVKAGIIDAAA